MVVWSCSGRGQDDDPGTQAALKNGWQINSHVLLAHAPDVFRVDTPPRDATDSVVQSTRPSKRLREQAFTLNCLMPEDVDVIRWPRTSGATPKYTELKKKARKAIKAFKKLDAPGTRRSQRQRSKPASSNRQSARRNKNEEQAPSLPPLERGSNEPMDVDEDPAPDDEDMKEPESSSPPPPVGVQGTEESSASPPPPAGVQDSEESSASPPPPLWPPAKRHRLDDEESKSEACPPSAKRPREDMQDMEESSASPPAPAGPPAKRRRLDAEEHKSSPLAAGPRAKRPREDKQDRVLDDEPSASPSPLAGQRPKPRKSRPVQLDGFKSGNLDDDDSS